MVQSLLNYIKKSPECFHAIDTLSKMLDQAGYTRLEDGSWKLEPGKTYYTVRFDSALIAFRMPEQKPRNFMITASHSDSPCPKIRDHAERQGDYIRLDVERYGGMINASWVDRPLSVAGRVLVRTPEGVDTRLVDLEKDCVLIPNVAIHMNRAMNDNLTYDPYKDLVPLYGAAESAGCFNRELAEKAGCKAEDILATDLYVYNNQAGVHWGPNKEFISSPRLDDLGCVFTSAQGLLKSKPSTDSIQMLCVFCNEEIGSGTKQGAASEFLPDVLQAIAEATGLNNGDLRAMLAQSMMLSCDNGHSKHPNHPELADPNEAPMMNGGVVIKHSPKYATDGMASAVFSEICRRADVPVQHYANRPDQAGGSTLGNIANCKTGLITVDIGMAQIAMHSAMETAGSKDVDAMIRANEAFYNTKLTMVGGKVIIE